MWDHDCLWHWRFLDSWMMRLWWATINDGFLRNILVQSFLWLAWPDSNEHSTSTVFVQWMDRNVTATTRHRTPGCQLAFSRKYFSGSGESALGYVMTFDCCSCIPQIWGWEHDTVMSHECNVRGTFVEEVLLSMFPFQGSRGKLYWMSWMAVVLASQALFAQRLWRTPGAEQDPQNLLCDGVGTNRTWKNLKILEPHWAKRCCDSISWGEF